MVKQDINKLRIKLENQLSEQTSFDKIYETSIAIDKLLIDYYKEKGLVFKQTTQKI